MKISYSQDPDGKEMLVRDDAPLAMAWEKPYIEACIEALAPAGDVLEVGYGLGFGSACIKTYHPATHTVIEAHPAVAAKARAAGLHVIEDTWENALPNLGSFDAIFFYDYACKLILKKETEKFANILVKAGKALVENTFKKFSLKSIRYSDADLAGFMKMMETKGKEDSRMVLRFFSDLYKNNQITLHQWESLCSDLAQRNWASPEEIAKANERMATLVLKHDSRVLDFLEACLEKHMKKGSRFSCYVDDPTSKYEDPAFMEKVIHNPALDYTERFIDVEVPAHCPYYRENSALVMKITKA